MTRGDLVAALRGRTLAACIDSGRDNMTALRLLAALLVLLGHSYVLSATADSDPLHRLFGSTYSHFIGVMMFFAISGLLITLAWQRRPRIGYFLRSRALRILPALLVCVSACALLLGAAATTLPLREYFGTAGTWAYIAGNVSLVDLRWTLPGVFGANPATDFVNGSLWTLPIEAALYLVVAAIGLAGLLTRQRWLATLVIAVLATIWLARPLTAARPLATDAILVAFFVFGALCCIHRAVLPVSTAVLLVLAAAAWSVRGSLLYAPLLGLCIAYATLWLAYVPRIPRIRFGDLSYGTYLWGFPVQQALIHWFGISGAWAIFLCAAPVALLLAAASWRLVEQPALRLKNPRARAPASRRIAC